MAYCVELPRSGLRLRVSVLTLIAVGFAGCSSDVTRFDASPFSSGHASRSASPVEATGSVSRGPAAPTGKVEAQPLPTTAALPPPPPKNPSSTGVAAGAGGMASYRPPHVSGEVTGSVAAAPAPKPASAVPPLRTAAAAPALQPGKAAVVTIGPGDTIAVLSRRHGVSIAAIIKANGLTSPNSVRIGQQIRIPGKGAPVAVAATAPRQTPVAPAAAPAAPSYGGFHIAGPGDTLTKIAQRYRVSVADLARANRIQTRTQVKLGDRLAIPSQAAARPAAPAPAARAETAAPTPKPQAAPPQQVASVEPQHTANLASPTENPEADGKREAGGAVFRWPVRGRIVTAFGAKPNGQQNDGINIAVPEGTPVKAAEDGEVAYAGSELKGYGNLILVRHSNGFVTAYAHASELMVKRGDKVKRGQVIGKSGRTGNVSAPQLHFEIRKGSTPVDPTPYLGA